MATMRNNTGVKMTGKVMGELEEALKLLATTEVLVGFPEETTDRTDDSELTNASLGYIHDQGAPEANIPQREFMKPGIESVQDKIAAKLGQTMRAILRGGNYDTVAQGLGQVGFIAMSAIKNKIDEGVPPPLSDYTLRQRMKKNRKGGGGARKGAAIELDRRWDDQAPSVEFAKPLVDTAAMRNSVNYAIRARKKRGA